MNWKFKYSAARLVKLTFVSIFTIHLAACLNYLIAATYRNPMGTWIGVAFDDYLKESLPKRYLIAVYWAITTFSTVGYGDLHPVTVAEMLFGCSFMLVNLALTAYILGNITILLVPEMTRTRKYRDMAEAFCNFAKRNQVPALLERQVLSHLEINYRTEAEHLQQGILNQLPKALKSSMSHCLFSNVVYKAYLFLGVSDDTLFQLVSKMKVEYFLPGEYVILHRQTPTDLYLVVNGVLDLLFHVNGRETEVGIAIEGHLCGEIGVVCNEPQILSVRARQPSQTLKIKRSSFMKIIASNPLDGSKIVENFLQAQQWRQNHVNTPPLVKSTLEKNLVDTTNLLARGNLNIKVDLAYAVSKGYDKLLEILLKKENLDPNQLHNGTTALHIATEKRSKECVLVLLKYNANPNLPNKDGQTARSLASKEGYEEIRNIFDATAFPGGLTPFQELDPARYFSWGRSLMDSLEDKFSAEDRVRQELSDKLRVAELNLKEVEEALNLAREKNKGLVEHNTTLKMEVASHEENLKTHIAAADEFQKTIREKDEEAAQALKVYKLDVADSYAKGFDMAVKQAKIFFPDLDFSKFNVKCRVEGDAVVPIVEDASSSYEEA